MNGEDRLDGLEERIVTIEALEVRRYEACLPVVAVNNVGLPAKSLEGFKHTPAEEDKALIVVFVVLASDGTLIDPISPKVVCVVEEVNLDLFLEIADEGRFDVAELCFFAYGNRYFLESDDIVKLESPFADETIAGHHDPDLVPQFFDCLRECAGDVGESSSFRKWIYLTRQKQDV